MMIPTTIILANQLPKLNLNMILQLRSLGVALTNNINEELATKELLLSNILDFQMDSTHYFIATTFILFLYGQHKYLQGQESSNKKIVKIQKFESLKKIVGEIFFIFMIIFAKNIETAS